MSDKKETEKTEETVAVSIHTGQITNREFAKRNGKFIRACESAEIKPSKRQASKWRRGRGIARKSG